MGCGVWGCGGVGVCVGVWGVWGVGVWAWGGFGGSRGVGRLALGDGWDGGGKVNLKGSYMAGQPGPRHRVPAPGPGAGVQAFLLLKST